MSSNSKYSRATNDGKSIGNSRVNSILQITGHDTDNNISRELEQLEC